VARPEAGEVVEAGGLIPYQLSVNKNATWAAVAYLVAEH